MKRIFGKLYVQVLVAVILGGVAALTGTARRDTLTEAGIDISNGMAQVAKLYNLEEQCVNDLKVLSEAACLQHTESKRLTAKVSNMPLA